MRQGQPTQSITDREVTPATTSDVKELPGIQKRLEEVGMKPGEQYADAGFVNGQTIGDSRDRVISLEYLSSERFQSFEKFQAEDRSLDTDAFETSLEGDGRNEIVRAKHIPTGKALRESTGKMLVDFDPAICSACRISDTRQRLASVLSP